MRPDATASGVNVHRQKNYDLHKLRAACFPPSWPETASRTHPGDCQAVRQAYRLRGHSQLRDGPRLLLTENELESMAPEIMGAAIFPRRGIGAR